MHKRHVLHLPMHKMKRDAAGAIAMGRYTGVKDITTLSSLSPTACFMGPRAQNAEAMRSLATKAIDNIVAFRESFKPTDPNIALDADNDASLAEMMLRYDDLLAFLKTYSTPYTSMRYQAHMTWDNLLPALGAYFVGMMYNSNNVTIQASTATTLLEMQVMRDLCDMYAYRPIDITTPEGQPYVSGPWAHVTADGTIANIEGVWSAREAKYLPIAIRELIRNNQDILSNANGMMVTSCDGVVYPLMTAEAWPLINMKRNDRLMLPQRVADLCGRPVSEIWSMVPKYDVNTLGLDAFGTTPVIMVPSTGHYSWPKAAGLLGIGTERCVHVNVDVNARMSIEGVRGLRERLDAALLEKTPILCVVSVFGSTEEGAVDPLDDILTVRETYRAQGLDFDVHVDSAWGGYFVSMVRKPYSFDDNVIEAEPFLTNAELDGSWISDYVANQARRIRDADSLTVDPHKMGYVQYPAGSVAYANQDVVNLTTFTGAYIGASSEPTVGLFGIEGSRPGAAAAAVYFSHTCLRPDVSGYGRVINLVMLNRLMYYWMLADVRAVGKYETTPLTPYPSGTTPQEALAKLQSGDATASNDQRAVGPDQNLVDYGVNPFINGVKNTDPQVYNDFIVAIYDKFHIGYNAEGESNDIQLYNFLVSMTIFKRSDYGDAFMDDFAQRLGLVGRPDELGCLRSTVMNPFINTVVDSNGAVYNWWSNVISIMNTGITEVYNEFVSQRR